jgi:hypothetical protein
MKNRIVLIALLVTATGSATLHAQGSFYIGAGIGNTFFSDDYEDALNQVTEISENSTSWKIFVGAGITPNLALEGGYRDFGTIETNIAATAIESGSTAWDVALRGSIPIAFLEAFGKIGAMFLRNETTYNSLEAVYHSSNFMWGIGAGAKAGPIGIRLEWESMVVDIPDGLSMVSLGASFGN